MLDSLFERFENLIVLDTETTGISPETDEIIELGFLSCTARGSAAPEREEDYLIRLTPGRRLPAAITNLTGIDETMLSERGVEKAEAGERLVRALSCDSPLVAAYNAQFDLGFLYFFLRRLGREDVLRRARFLDIMTVYRDRRDYPHRLLNAVEAYGVPGRNSHRAVDDARAALEVLSAMGGEEDDLARYIDLFGYNPKYGVSGRRISSIQYKAQPYTRSGRLYEG